MAKSYQNIDLMSVELLKMKSAFLMSPSILKVQIWWNTRLVVLTGILQKLYSRNNTTRKKRQYGIRHLIPMFIGTPCT